LSTHYEIYKHFYNNIRSQTKTPLIYEIDDLLIDIPEWNYAHDYYKENFIFISEMMKMSDGLSVSTEKLKEVYSKFNSKIVVIPNHLPKFLWGDIEPKWENKNKWEDVQKNKPRILWAGSENHFCNKNLSQKYGRVGGDFGDKLIDFIKKTINDYQWVLVGGFPLELADLKNKGIEYHGWRDILHYPQFIKTLNVDICIAPLLDNLFNACKSNIKMLEYTAMGCPGVYSYIDPYKDAYLASKTEDEFIGNIERLVKNYDLRKLTFDTDYATIKDNLFWENDNNVKKYVNSYLGLFGKRLE